MPLQRQSGGSLPSRVGFARGLAVTISYTIVRGLAVTIKFLIVRGIYFLGALLAPEHGS